jgi:hypothetical protein
MWKSHLTRKVTLPFEVGRSGSELNGFGLSPA